MIIDNGIATGTLTLKGNLEMNGSGNVSMTGSLLGTSSYASSADIATRVYTPGGTANRLLYQAGGGAFSSTTTDGNLTFNSGTSTLNSFSMAVASGGTFKSALDGTNNISMHDGSFGIIAVRNGSVDKITIYRGAGSIIKLSGSVLIDSNSPSAKHEITGSLSVTGSATFTNNITANNLTATSGVKFGSGANFLNYYEEGTWTPSLRGSSVAGTVTYQFISGTYTRIGNQVFIRWGFKLSSISGASGTMQISGLPFTSVTWGPYQEPGTSVSTGLLATADYAQRARVFVGGASTYMEGRITNNADTTWNISEFSGDEYVIGELFYNV